MRPRALAWFLLANAAGGASYAATGYALRGFSPAPMAFWRTALALPLLWPWLAPALRRGLSGREWARVLALGALGLAAPLVVGNVGQELSTSVNAAILVGVEPVSVVLLAALFLGERLTGRRLGAIALGFSGSALIVTRGGRLSWDAPQAGDALLALTGLLWASYTVLGKPLLRRLPAGELCALATAAAAPLLLLCAWPELPRGVAAPPSASALWGLAFLTVAVSAGGALAWLKALELAPASALAPFVFVQPLIGAGLGVLLHGEPLGPATAAGGLLIVAGAVLAAREPAY